MSSNLHDNNICVLDYFSLVTTKNRFLLQLCKETLIPKMLRKSLCLPTLVIKKLKQDNHNSSSRKILNASLQKHPPKCLNVQHFSSKYNFGKRPYQKNEQKATNYILFFLIVPDCSKISIPTSSNMFDDTTESILWGILVTFRGTTEYAKPNITKPPFKNNS